MPARAPAPTCPPPTNPAPSGPVAPRSRPAAAQLRGGVALAAVAALVSACVIPGAGVRQSPAPPAPRPAALADPTAGLPHPPSAASQAVRAYYAQVAQMLLDQGLLRQERAPADAPFTDRQLVDNFVRIALYDEYAREGGDIVARQHVSRLRRWEVPVRMSVEFGASVPGSQQRVDRGNVTAYAGRLARATGHPVGMVDDPARANFNVLILNEDERQAIAPRLRAMVPGIDAAAVRTVTNLTPATFCVVFAFSQGQSAAYSHAVAVIRGEHPDILRLSCIHEELAQGMGLANDSPAARPSIFNDDEEFALLTRHDEMLLRILYDRRLHPGMTEAEARPIVARIAAELMGTLD
ncbi:hypothetical protein SAMN05878426_10512 [Phaeovulum vinaykumarii]|uniref:DUF2927 domain-containing protein n=1 Tax=Phaeovulum vinaykumarii TaxID=407234 RepID=A0A1N7M4Q3_9RHOB|nr:Protein of unknown function [Phaeovulum vinaykumarii]SOC08709.1 hypothetical protein SAMN05878426_10512 [Phaeovulum vinaykumarii]